MSAVHMVQTMSELHGCVAVVTGAGRGLGAALALAFADAGCRMIICGRNEDALRHNAAAITERSKRPCDVIQLDLAAADSVAAALATIRASHEKIDVLVNNGAMWLEGRSTPYSAQEIMGTINSAVSGTFLFVQGLLPQLNKSHRPDIVTIGSTSSLPTAALRHVSVPFYAAKRAQGALADGFRQQLLGTPVRSIIINPPDLDDISTLDPEWDKSPSRQKGERATNRDIADAVIFAVTRPRHINLSITVDADQGGVFS